MGQQVLRQALQLVLLEPTELRLPNLWLQPARHPCGFDHQCRCLQCCAGRRQLHLRAYELGESHNRRLKRLLLARKLLVLQQVLLQGQQLVRLLALRLLGLERPQVLPPELRLLGQEPLLARLQELPQLVQKRQVRRHR